MAIFGDTGKLENRVAQPAPVAEGEIEAKYKQAVAELQRQDMPITREEELAADEINRRYPGIDDSILDHPNLEDFNPPT